MQTGSTLGHKAVKEEKKDLNRKYGGILGTCMKKRNNILPFLGGPQ